MTGAILVPMPMKVRELIRLLELKGWDALLAHFEAMREVGEPIPEPHASVAYVEVAA